MKCWNPFRCIFKKKKKNKYKNISNKENPYEYDNIYDYEE